MEIIDSSDMGEAVWEVLARDACQINAQRMIVPKRDRRSTAKVEWVTTVEHYGRAYASLNKRLFVCAMSTDWIKTILDLCSVVLYRCSEGGQRCAIESAEILTWILSALRASKNGYALAFETLQFSSYIDVLFGQGQPAPLEPGACAFLGAKEEHEVVLLWQGSSWSPIASGFVVAASVG
jgi:hypothetical protein